jgi:hypothetical protein
MVRTVMMCHGIFFMVTRIMLILTSSLAIAVAGHRHALVFLLPAISATIFIAHIRHIFLPAIILPQPRSS